MSYYFYRFMIDPLLTGVRKTIKDLVDPNSTIIDIGCGTGELVFYLSPQAKKVVGLDMNEEVLKYSRMKKRRLQISNVEFVSKDVNDSDFLSEAHFDYAVLSMVLHQFSLAEANQVLNSARRVAKYIVMIDFTCPLPENAIGWGAKLIERIAGGQHYMHFKEYQRHNGLNYFLDYHRLAIIESRVGGLGDIRIIKALEKNPQES
ncbi:MAG: class I SAM-dependent methyltransferase [Atribacterota bacterium]